MNKSSVLSSYQDELFAYIFLMLRGETNELGGVWNTPQFTFGFALRHLGLGVPSESRVFRGCVSTHDVS